MSMTPEHHAVALLYRPSADISSRRYVMSRDSSAVPFVPHQYCMVRSPNHPLCLHCRVRLKFNEMGTDLQGSAVSGPAARAGNLLPDKITV